MALHVLSRPYILLSYPQSSTLYWNPVPAGSVPLKYQFLSNSLIPFTQSPEISYFSSTRQHTKYIPSVYFGGVGPVHTMIPYRKTKKGLDAMYQVVNHSTSNFETESFSDSLSSTYPS